MSSVHSNDTGILDNSSVFAVQRSGSLSESSYAPVGVTFLSTLSTAVIFYLMSQHTHQNSVSNFGNSRSTPLPGYGTFGDRVNELLEVFLDALAIYVHNDKNWDCSRRMLCEVNRRAVGGESGSLYGILTYFLSLSVSFLLRDQRVSESMEAMRRGRHGLDCVSSYPRCPFSL